MRSLFPFMFDPYIRTLSLISGQINQSRDTTRPEARGTPKGMYWFRLRENGEGLVSESLSIAFRVGIEYYNGKLKVSVFRIYLPISIVYNSLSAGDHDGYFGHPSKRVRCLRLL